MNARELRIGNWIFHTGGLGYIQVTGEMIAHIERFPDEKFMTSPPRDILKPIELTGERLIKCGFENIFNNEIFKIRTIEETLFLQVQKVEHGYVAGIKNTAGYISLTMINYLHQLQNLYYCLTGKELEIKEL